MSSVLATMALAVAGAAVPIFFPATPAAADVPAGVTRFGSIAVDPVSGRVFVAGDDKVEAFDPAGVQLGTISEVHGAQAMSFDGGYLWVAQTATGAIAKINPSTLAKVGEFATGGPVGIGLATVGGLIWFTSSAGDSEDARLKTLDPATGVVTDRGALSGDGDLVERPGSDTHLLWLPAGSWSPYSVYSVDVRTNPATIDGDVEHGVGSNLSQIAATEHGTFVTAARTPYRFDEFSTEPTAGILKATGVVYPATNHPNAVAYSPARQGVFAGTTSTTDKLFVWMRGVPVAAQEIALPGYAVPRGVALSNDASLVYSLTAQSGRLRLGTYSLTPTVTSTSKTTIVAERTERVAVAGTGLGSIDSVTLGGTPVPFAHDGANSLVLDIRTSLAPGNRTLLLQGPFGSISRTMRVVANGSATVGGTVTSGDVPVDGATVTLNGETGGARTATTESDGTYALEDVPNGPHYDVVVTSDSVTVAVDDIEIDGPAETFDVDLQEAPERDLTKRTIQLPPGAVRRLVVDQTTGRTYVAVGDQIAVYDRDGRPTGRLDRQWSVSDLQIVGTTLYAMLGRAGTVSVIDLPSLTVSRSVPLQRTSTGSLAVAGNRLHYTDGDNQFTNIVSLDLATGLVGDHESGTLYTPVLGPVGGNPNNFLSWEVGISSSDVIHWAGEQAPSTPLAVTPHSLFGHNPGDLVASSDDDRVWAADGRELNLSTMTTTGITYPKAHGFNGAVAHTPGHGGVLVFGRSISQRGVVASSHLTAAQPATRSVGIDAAGERVSTATADGNLVISDLAPVVNAITPNPVVETPTNVVIAGAGLGAATSVDVDGISVPFSAVDADHLNVSLPSMAVGQHDVTVETPWGTSVPRRLSAGSLAPATVSAVSPATGPATGGSTVTLSGSGFLVASAVSIGGRTASEFTVVSDTEITVTVPAHPAGDARVVVTKAGGDSAGGPMFRYTDPKPTGPIPALSEDQWVGRSYRPFGGDFNGDGVGDVFMYQPGAGADHIRLYRGDGTFTTRTVHVTGRYQPLAGDFNGDGTTDVLWYQPGVGADYQWDFAPDGSYVSTRRNATGRYQPFVGNFNGDDYDDIFWYQPGVGADHQWNYGPGGYVSTPRTATGTYRPFTGDFDGNGYDDIFWYGPGRARDYQWSYGPGGTYESTTRTATGTYQPFTGDFDGNGYDDIFWYGPGSAPDFLWRYANGGNYQSQSVTASMNAIPVVSDLTGGGVDDIFWYGPGSAPDDAMYPSPVWFMSPIVR